MYSSLPFTGIGLLAYAGVGLATVAIGLLAKFWPR